MIVGKQLTIEWTTCAIRSSPRGLTNTPIRLPDNGNFVYRDAYNQVYRNEWKWIYNGSVLDITVIIEQPYVWGEDPVVEFRGRNLFRRGIVTSRRTLLRPFNGGYEVMSDNSDQRIDFVNTSYHCSVIPIDPFYYHLNQGTLDETLSSVTDGPRLADPDNNNDVAINWGNVDNNGNVSGLDIVEFVDVWSN